MPTHKDMQPFVMAYQFTLEYCAEILPEMRTISENDQREVFATLIQRLYEQVAANVFQCYMTIPMRGIAAQMLIAEIAAVSYLMVATLIVATGIDNTLNPLNVQIAVSDKLSSIFKFH